jgi:hypothetical protein
VQHTFALVEQFQQNTLPELPRALFFILKNSATGCPSMISFEAGLVYDLAW